MADVGDIKPTQPVWPKRPADKTGPGGRRPDLPSKERRPSPDDKDRKDEGRDDGHFDDYA